MRFSAILFPLTILTGLILASPVEERSTGLSAVASAVKPKFANANGQVRPSVAAHVEGGNASNVTVTDPGVSKRADYNELTGRATPYATLVVCTGYGCSGNCYGYYLPVRPWTCYATGVTFYSLYVWATDGLTYGVYVGPNCYGLSRHAAFRGSHLSDRIPRAGAFVPYVNTCYNINPYGNTYFIN